MNSEEIIKEKSELNKNENSDLYNLLNEQEDMQSSLISCHKENKVNT